MDIILGILSVLIIGLVLFVPKTETLQEKLRRLNDPSMYND